MNTQEWFRGALSGLLVSAALLGANAHAGVDDVARRIKASAVSNVLSNWMIRETLVRGWYALHHPSGQFEPYIIDENATMLRTNEGWQPLGNNGLSRALDAAGEQRLRAAFVPAMRVENAIAYRFGNGMKQVALITAFDCPVCKMLEHEMASAANTLDATIYVFPMSLDFRNSAAMETAARLWCRPDAAATWRSVMVGGVSPKMVPPGQPLSGGCAFRNATATRTLARMTGAAGTPTLMFEDGSLRTGAMSAAELRNVFGRVGRSP